MDFLPETMEEKLICYADKFYSKTHLECEKSIEKRGKEPITLRKGKFDAF